MKKVVDNSHSRTWRIWIIAGYVIVVAVIALIWAFTLFTPLDDSEEQRQVASLEAIANAGSIALENSKLTDEAVVGELAASGEVRATIIGLDGTVIADSNDDVKTMSNHADRAEFTQALSSDYGHDRRVSSTDGIEYLYVAVKATSEGKPVVLRVSMPMSELDAYAKKMRDTGLILMIAAVIIAIIIARFVFARSSRPIDRLERVRTDFVANASHELKTPVAGIKLLSESIEQANEDGNTELVHVFTERLRKESDRLQNLVTDLLDLSRIEQSNGHAQNRASCDLYSTVAASYESHRLTAEGKGLVFVFEDDVDTDENCRVNLSPTDAMLLIDNLAENAIRYTDAGEVKIRLQAEDDEMVLTVSDSGVGIPQTDQARIFERFYRVDTARSREMGGTGLGLSLVRHVVELGNGSIDLQSAPEEGSVFTVRLPRAN